MEPREQELAAAYAVILKDLPGFDPKTQGRAARAFQNAVYGYLQNPREVVGEGLFEAPTFVGEVAVRNIPFYSLCEHHLLPFFGTVDIVYTHDHYILGLSKFSRVVAVFAKRLQTQERMTHQIADALHEILLPYKITVTSRARHLCMEMRGYASPNTETVCTASWED